MEIIATNIITQVLVKKSVDIVVEQYQHRHMFKAQRRHVRQQRSVRHVARVMDRH